MAPISGAGSPIPPLLGDTQPCSGVLAQLRAAKVCHMKCSAERRSLYVQILRSPGYLGASRRIENHRYWVRSHTTISQIVLIVPQHVRGSSTYLLFPASGRRPRTRLSQKTATGFTYEPRRPRPTIAPAPSGPPRSGHACGPRPFFAAHHWRILEYTRACQLPATLL
jgi:hypothetical protein